MGMTRKPLALLAIPLLAACGTTARTAATTASPAAPASATSQAAAPAVEAPAPAVTLTAKDVQLSVKTLKKSCFGSAGCNVEYRIVAAVNKANMEDGASYSVTYDVTGLEDTQTATLTLKPDGTYSQDLGQFGSTKSSKAKLRAVVTSVEKEM